MHAHEGADTTSRTQRDVRTIMISSVLGTTIEWYDFFLYSTAAGTVFNKLFFPTSNPLVSTVLAFATFFVGFVARPLGGALFGHIGDRIGRKRTLVSTMVMMGAATAAMGVLPTYAQIGIWAPLLLVLLRLFQGLAVGGEWAGAVLMAVEYAPERKRAHYGSWPQLGLAIGLGLGTGLFALLGDLLSEEQFLSYGWRAAFGVSIVLVLVGLLIRLRVAETPAFQRMHSLREKAQVPLLDMFRERASRRNIVLGLLSRWSEGAAFNTWAVFFLSYATSTLKLPRTDVLVAVMLASATLAVLLPFAGSLADTWTPRRTYAVGAGLYALSVYPAFLAFQSGNPVLVGLVLVLVLGVVHSVLYAPQGTLYSQLTPVRSRYTGVSFVYQVSGIYASGLTPMLITSLLALGGGTPWLACGYLVLTGLIGMGATLALRREDLYLKVGGGKESREEPAAVAAVSR